MYKRTLMQYCTVVILGLAAMPMAQAQQQNPLSSQQLSSFMKTYGSNATLTLDQANKAADSHFAKLDTDHDGTVDKKELIPAGITDNDFTSMNPDKDKLVQKEEYMNLVKQKFSAADSNHNNTLTEAELNSEAGQALMRLLQ